MKNGLLFLLFFVCVSMASSQTISRDKYLHFGAGAVIGGVGGYAAHHIFGGDPYWTWTGAVGSSLAAGLLKEHMDKNEYGGWDNNDILFTVIGGAASGLVLDLLLKDNKRRRRGKACNCNAIHYGPSLFTEIPITFSKEGSGDLAASFFAQKILSEGTLAPNP